jgi:hypothetical protein
MFSSLRYTDIQESQELKHHVRELLSSYFANYLGTDHVAYTEYIVTEATIGSLHDLAPF